MNTFRVTATLNENWWSLRVKEEPGIITQARRLDEIPDVIKDALTLFPELTDDPQNAVIHVDVSNEDLAFATEARELNEKAHELSMQASAAMHSAAQDLSKQGFTLRDIGALLGVSHQRAQKLIKNA
ncbi:transcriptional regulator [Corynebacterium sp. sy017]|uniref:transcriptional regulator n=1 Tax=unclassified Corynebacterium TaxID=2624378 RepID=UPI0011858E7E|nr:MULTISPECIES: transcriptional regulator [unclassified Corynebacterium]MBP3088322.1 transcriptional regulator [Corynebacterium sp. sy017]TSD91643.1 transcriptional regulator [Corynebacterium sp. SY003]